MNLNKLSTTEINKLHNHYVARCFGKNGRPAYRSPAQHEGHGVAWKSISGADLSNVTCPVHEGAPLYQTTRNWRGAHEWTVVPPEQVKAAAQKKRAAKKAVVDAELAAGKSKYARDLQPGDLFLSQNRRRGGLHGGLVVEVEKLPKGKVRITTSKQREAVERGYLYHGSWKTDEVEARADKLEELVWVEEITGTHLVTTDKDEITRRGYGHWFTGVIEPRRFGNPAAEPTPFLGWATEHPAATLAGLWDREVKRWTKYLEEKQYVQAVLTSPWLSEEEIQRRREVAQQRAAADKAQGERVLQVAIDRLVRHTGSAQTSAD